MSISLSSADLKSLSRGIQLIVSPLDYPSGDAWRSAVLRCLKDLLHADSAGFHLPDVGGELFYTDDFTAEELDSELAPPDLPDGTCVVRRSIELEVCTLEGAYGPHRALLLASPYYNEYAAPIGKHDTLFANGEFGPPEDRVITSLQFWHERPSGYRFGQRELTLLRLLFPALRAGVDSLRRWSAHRSSLLSTLDALGQAVRVFDLTGRTLHETRGMSALLDADPEADVLRGEIVSAASVLCRMVRSTGSGGGGSLERPLATRVRTALAGYVLRVSLYRGTPAGAEGMILVGLERCTPVPRDEAELREATGLTRAEVRVARLIAQGRPNAEIAQELFISPHTARRHTEQILRKLQVRSRAEVAPTLLRSSP